MNDDYLIERAPESMVKVLGSFVADNHGVIAGSLFTTHLDDEGQFTPSHNCDVRIYLRNQSDYNHAFNALSEEYRLISKSPKSSLFSFLRGRVLILHMDYENPSDVLDRHAFTVDQFAFYRDAETNDYMTMKHSDFDQHHQSKSIHYSPKGMDSLSNTPISIISQKTRLGMNLPMETLTAILKYKLDTVPELRDRDYSVDDVIDAVMKRSRAHGISFSTKSDDFATKLFNEITRYSEPRCNYSQWGLGAKHQEKGYETSINAALEGAPDLENSKTVRRAEKTMGVSLFRNVNYTFAPSFYQVKLVELLSKFGTADDYVKLILSIVFSHRGFVSKNSNSTIPCECSESMRGTPITLSHECQYHKESSATFEDQPREDEAEVVFRLLMMEPGDRQWMETIAEYFNDLFMDTNITEYLTILEWDEALENNVFHVDLPYAILYKIMASSDG